MRILRTMLLNLITVMTVADFLLCEGVKLTALLGVLYAWVALFDTER